ncbi:hypothetical protein C8R44DRAFT_752079 [Mycena epipterygia]|nr:hypothetical protein C8R44DRAFT_752079 [Mycena epipterygia]
MTTHRRSFHLKGADALELHHQRTAAHTAGLNLNPQRIEASASLLALARQASAFAFTLLGGCAPGVRPHKRVPRALLAGQAGVDVEMGLQVGGMARTTSARAIKAAEDTSGGVHVVPADADWDGESNDAVSGPQDQVPPVMEAQVEEQADTEPAGYDTEVEEPQIQTTNAPADPEHAPPPAADSLVVPLEQPTAPRDVEHPAAGPDDLAQTTLDAPPRPHAQLRAALIRKVTAFTAARVARAAASPTTTAVTAPATPPRDDPFSATFAPTNNPHSSSNHPHPTLAARTALRLDVCANADQSPTPQPRPGRPPLRQQTIFFAVPASHLGSPSQSDSNKSSPQSDSKLSPQSNPGPTPPPTHWAPHPAGARSCAIPIRAPPPAPARAVGGKEKEKRKDKGKKDKENCAV